MEGDTAEMANITEFLKLPPNAIISSGEFEVEENLRIDAIEEQKKTDYAGPRSFLR